MAQKEVSGFRRDNMKARIFMLVVLVMSVFVLQGCQGGSSHSPTGSAKKGGLPPSPRFIPSSAWSTGEKAARLGGVPAGTPVR